MIDKNQKEEIEQFKKGMLSDNWEVVKSSGSRLGRIGGKEVTEFLISLLTSENQCIRNSSALALADIRDNNALMPLISAIFKNENHNCNGTLVYALKFLDCSKNLKDIFRILFYETYESKTIAYEIICDQIFDFTQQDLIEIHKMWNDCKLTPVNCPGYDHDETRAMMQDAVEGFARHLNTNI